MSKISDHALYHIDRPREECGVIGIFGNEEASKYTYFGLYALQHRGQESAGIATSNGKVLKEYRNMGLVSDVFREDTLSLLTGHMAVGHVRYSTTGSSILKNAQPFVAHYAGLDIALAHNGNLTNSRELRRYLEKEGAIFQTTMDTELIVHILVRHLHLGLEEALLRTMSRIEGAYSLAFIVGDKLIAVRDPFGFRPLCLGRLEGGYMIASETCALDLVEAEYVRDIAPGEILIIDENGLNSIKMQVPAREAFCIFEFIYFARPDSDIFGKNVYMVRKRLGHKLAQEFPVVADFTMPFPDSGNYAAIGFCHASGIPLEMGMIRNHYVGRTFIQPSQSMRDFGVKVKLNPVRPLLHNKRVIIIEDSIIRGTTIRHRVKALRAAGAREVHMLVSCPPHRYPCYYGIDFPSPNELIANQKSIDEIKEFIGLDCLCYLSLDGMVEATEIDKEKFCLACFTGQYPVRPCHQFSKLCLE